MQNKLAIIIPAYKPDFLSNVFDCLKAQTCQNYNLYVFDDCSPYNIKDVFNRYFSESSNSFYIRFEYNMGSVNLAEHWNRCVKKIGDEEWIWLFSDDDVMDTDCVQKFYEFKDKEKTDVLRFQLSIIENNGQLRKHTPQYPVILSSERFFSMLNTGLIDARMPEFILRAQKLKEIGGYRAFDLAWRSDNATVMEMAYPKGIYTIDASRVYWRSSKKNISGTGDNGTLYRKQQASIDFFNWVNQFFIKNNINYSIGNFRLMRIYQRSTLRGNKRLSLPGSIKTVSMLMNINSIPKIFYFIFWTIFEFFTKK